MHKKGIALLITLLFIMAITVSIGIGLKYINSASNELSKENFMLENFAVINDALAMLKKSQKIALLAKEESSEVFYTILHEASFIPYENSGLNVTLELSSARSKFNPNTLIDENSTKINEVKYQALKEYLKNNNLSDNYINILLDSMSGIKSDLSYRTGIYDEKPYLFRDYISSDKHLSELNDFYTSLEHNNDIKNINFNNLFYFSKNKKMAIDLNFATAEVWELILGTNKQRAKQLSAGGGFYENIESLSLSDSEKLKLSRFNVSYFEPYIDVKINIQRKNQNSYIRFEYNIKSKKGSNFSYEI